MKFVAPRAEVVPQIWLLSNDMVNAIDSSGIGFNNLYRLPEYHDRIAESDIIAIAVAEYSMAMKLGSPTTDVFDAQSYQGARGEVLQAKIKQTLEGLPRLAILSAFANPGRFYVRDTQSGFILCQGEEKPAGAVWIDSEESLFANALLKGIYNRLGYYQLHFNDVTSTKPGYFNLADVLRILA